jgi:hypothetical protein
MHICMYTHVHVWVYKCICIHDMDWIIGFWSIKTLLLKAKVSDSFPIIGTYIHMYVYTCTCMGVYVYVYMYVYTCTCMGV